MPRLNPTGNIGLLDCRDDHRGEDGNCEDHHEMMIVMLVGMIMILIDDHEEEEIRNRGKGTSGGACWARGADKTCIQSALA